MAADNAVKHGGRSREHREMLRELRKLLKDQEAARHRVQLD